MSERAPKVTDAAGKRRIAVLSATPDDTYAFFAPLTAQAWRRIGFEPLLLLVGGEAAWACGRARLALEEAAQHARVVFVPAVVGVTDATMAQVVRLLAAALDGALDDELWLSDIDLWPLAAERYRTEAGYAFHLFNADAYGESPDRFPMCHLVASRSHWREVFALEGGLAMALARVPWPADGDWHFDERWASARLRAWPHFLERCRRVPRPASTGHGRLDRSDWRFGGTLDHLVDAHLLRPGFTDENWPHQRALLAMLLESDALAAADAYRARSLATPAAGDDLEVWFRRWFRAVAELAPEPYRSYGGYGDGEPNGTACSVEAVRAFAALVDDPDAIVLNAGAGVTSFLLRRLFRRVVCVDGDSGYLAVVRRLCLHHGLSGDGFVVGLENAPNADFTFYDYGEITEEGRLGNYALAYRKTRSALYFDDTDDRPHGFPRYRQLIVEFAAAQGILAEDRRDACDPYGRWGVVLRKPAPPASGLIAFSLWGQDPLYLRGAIENMREAAAYYPGYRLRIYTDDVAALDETARATAGCDSTTLAARFGVALEVVKMAPSVGIRGMFWRYLAASDQQADPILFRDCDSRLNPREAAAVRARLETGRKFHVMRDHPDHAAWPILGGMWGVRGGVIDDMERRVAAWNVWAQKPDDMHFLAAALWPEARRDMLHHASVATSLAPTVPFPPHPTWQGYVGEIVRS